MTDTSTDLAQVLADLRTVHTLPDQHPQRQAWLTAKREIVRRLDQP